MPNARSVTALILSSHLQNISSFIELNKLIMKSKRCLSCSGSGSADCGTCNGRKRLKHFMQLRVSFKTHRSEFIKSRGGIPDEYLREGLAKNIYCEQDSRVIYNFFLIVDNKIIKSIFNRDLRVELNQCYNQWDFVLFSKCSCTQVCQWTHSRSGKFDSIFSSWAKSSINWMFEILIVYIDQRLKRPMVIWLLEIK